MKSNREMDRWRSFSFWDTTFYIKCNTNLYQFSSSSFSLFLFFFETETAIKFIQIILNYCDHWKTRIKKNCEENINKWISGGGGGERWGEMGKSASYTHIKKEKPVLKISLRPKSSKNIVKHPHKMWCAHFRIKGRKIFINKWCTTYGIMRML